MAEIFIEGFGIVEIKGDAPDEIETTAILNALGEEPRPTGIEEGPPPETIPALTGEPVPPEGPFGVVPAEARRSVRETVEEAPGLLSFLAELTPATVGTALGGTAGFAFGGPPGALGGGILGGIAGEAIGQELGITPVSEMNLALAGAGPIAGRVAGALTRFSGRVLGGAVTLLPPARVAQARRIAGEATEAIESLGTKILTRSAEAVKKGVAGVGKVRAQTASELYNALRRAGVNITPDRLQTTKAGLAALKAEMAPISEFTDVKQSIRVIEQMERTLLSGPIDFQTFVTARQTMGAAIRKAQNAGGIKLGSAKQAFKAMSQDLDDFAKAAPTKKIARLAQAATKRAKLEFGVRDMEQIIARFTKLDPAGEGLVINFAGIANKFRDLSNPKSKFFDKNFTDALKDDLPDIIKNLRVLSKIAKAGSPGGPGSLVVRGRGAALGSGVIGGALGFIGFGGPGAAIGALAGAQLPELMLAIFSSKPGMIFLKAAAKLGRGEVSRRAWMIAGQIALRSAGESEETIQKFAVPPLSREEIERNLNAPAAGEPQ